MTALLKRKEWRERCFLYIIGLRDGDTILKHSKIGISANIEKRIAAISTSQPFEVYCHMSQAFKNSYAAQRAEYQAHSEFAHIRGRGEWFMAYPEDLEVMVQELWARQEPRVIKYLF